MRLLLEHDANRMIRQIDALMSDARVNPFRYKSLNTRILSGEEEGAFAWIALNYIRNYFSRKHNGNNGVTGYGRICIVMYEYISG